PEIRENNGEIELATKKNLPRLVELKDIKGDLHTHSSFPIEPSHDLGANTMEDMLLKARSLEYEYLGFSEHNPSVSKHTNAQVYSILKHRKDIIDQINSSNKYVRAISLLEVDILSDGSLAIDNKAIDLLDGVIAGIHSSLSMDRKKMTERVMSGLSNPKVKIFAHPTGRLINERQGYDLDWEKIFDCVIKHNKALEINAWPNRLDLPDSLVKTAINAGVKIVIDTDSHTASQMELMLYGVAVARRGWCTKENILNTLPYNKFMQWLKS
ncbi:PHP domain-containing protein, partial [Candidatus Parcubacteria bacterium]